MSVLGDLYQQVILDHNKSPRNYRVMPDATRSVEGINPFCGDHYTVYVRIDGQTLADISFEGAGCAISKASASVMSSVLKGMTTAEAGRTFEDFHRIVTEGLRAGEELEHYGRLGAFAGVQAFPARVKCAMLAWHALHEALKEGGAKVTTE
jgi:nitrogen fixation NifU-like protein